jgi:molybdopterin-containing oxidoreductase family iron-sulfur binding subunit
LGDSDGEWDLARWFRDPSKGIRPDLEWELLKLAKNPDVTVRMRGVMEKCTFCIQRIHKAQDKAKSEGREVEDGEFTTACAQACPASAITFGRVDNPESLVAQLARSPRSEHHLEELGTLPNVTYLKGGSRNVI